MCGDNIKQKAVDLQRSEFYYELLTHLKYTNYNGIISYVKGQNRFSVLSNYCGRLSTALDSNQL